MNKREISSCSIKLGRSYKEKKKKKKRKKEEEEEEEKREKKRENQIFKGIEKLDVMNFLFV